MPSGVKHSIRSRAVLGWGKVRRFYYAFLRPKYIEDNHLARSGKCQRCGACCKLMFVCPLLETNEDGHAACVSHDKRPKNCRIFPVDEADLRDRDLVLPHSPCGFSFSEETVGQVMERCNEEASY